MHISNNAFAANGVFHPSSLVFIDWFLVRASHSPLSEPPSLENLQVLHAISSAIVDQTASILTTHFSKFTYAFYSREFPCVLPQGASTTVSSRRRLRRLGICALRNTHHSLPADYNDPVPTGDLAHVSSCSRLHRRPRLLFVRQND